MMRARKILAVILVLTLLAVVAFAGGQQDKAATGKLVPMKIIFPRSLEVLDDYYLTVALANGYFEQEGIKATAEGALGTTDSTKLVAQGFGEVCLPSPPVLMTAVANGLPLTMTFEQDKNYIFGFAVRKDSGINSIADLKGKKISVGDAGWTVIMDPLFKKVAGFTSKDVEVVVGGTGRAQLVAEGKADAVFTWEKEYQLWWGQGLDFKILSGYEAGVRFPGNGLTFANKYIKEHPKQVEGFCRAWAKGIYFGKINPAAATEITLKKYPMIGVPFQDAIKAIKAAVWVMAEGPVVEKNGLGYIEKTHWAEMRDILADEGALPSRPNIDTFLSNDFIKAANDFDKAQVEAQAKAYKLDPENAETLKKLGLNEYGW
jgi:ABC-type nitrate/sulfonate/bicarbonate transport system substrate-binding protein